MPGILGRLGQPIFHVVPPSPELKPSTLAARARLEPSSFRAQPILSLSLAFVPEPVIARGS